MEGDTTKKSRSLYNFRKKQFQICQDAWFLLHYIADLDIPLKRGGFIEFRTAMLNVAPCGRDTSREERNEYEKFDLAHKIRETMVAKLKAQFPDFLRT